MIEAVYIVTVRNEGEERALTADDIKFALIDKVIELHPQVVPTIIEVEVA